MTSWRALQRLYFYFYSEMSLRYYWLNRYFYAARSHREDMPLFLITPANTASKVGMGMRTDA